VSELALAAVLAITIVLASMVSVEIGISVALIELAAGVVVGNVFTITVPDWLSFIGSFAGVVLTYLAASCTWATAPIARRCCRRSCSG